MCNMTQPIVEHVNTPPESRSTTRIDSIVIGLVGKGANPLPHHLTAQTLIMLIGKPLSFRNRDTYQMNLLLQAH